MVLLFATPHYSVTLEQNTNIKYSGKTDIEAFSKQNLRSLACKEETPSTEGSKYGLRIFNRHANTAIFTTKDSKLSRKDIKRSLRVFQRHPIDKPQMPSGSSRTQIDEYYEIGACATPEKNYGMEKEEQD
jgi:hypothetical protein